ncbi:MobF family relaxase [cf. Phormidesmis sp. LEGE 11477]|uniref:MobF family relaxase n=1 Tax=cf. Phormidesmis sp. LEGE 11477 TaxID=1828680 RepID=UPI00187E42AF|nr:MobF family relaxase [cf. Phormidesmis sp. LEGE 11477]MBE9063453.1 relaxase domain-containing protein [cf. Phormidesmis sp. LEGE 11477]
MLSLANVSASQAENYYESDDYYTQGDPDLQSDSQWQGSGAENLDLEGPVDKAVFQQLLHGQTPDGKSLHSKAIKADNHRAATDYTFSAPKSVSIAALIQKDKRVIQAHDQAVKTALAVLENRYAQTRVRRGPGIREKLNTNNLIAATFRHETSREQDPQLHTHCVVINATQMETGKWQSLSNEAVLNNQKLLGEIYQNELAHQLRKHGYEIEPNGSGQFEVKGYEQPLLDLFSTRTQQIEAYIERWEAAIKESGGKPLNATQKKQATLATRLRKKSVPREVLLNGWHRAISSGEVTLPATPEAAMKEPGNQAPTAAIEGVNHASERESVFKREKAERFALEHHLGEQSFSELQTAMTEAGLLSAKHRYTTQTAIERELDTIAMMERGQGKENAIASEEKLRQLLSQETSLTEGQQQAIQTTATTTDQFIAWQGVAGAGKTYSLKLVAQLAKEQGYEVTGYAPSAQAANTLSEEANIESNTVARLLHSQGKSDRTSTTPKQPIWIVDEAGLLSAKDAHALLKKAQTQNARIILVGDIRQLSAVEAGNPFKSLQNAGIQTAYLEESRRQKTEALRAAVVCLSAGQQREGLERLDSARMVKEIADGQERHRQVVEEYMQLSPEARKKTLILSGTNAERLALTAQLRAALQAEGSLGADVYQLQSLRALDRTQPQLKYACVYAEGEVVVPVRDYRRYGLKKNAQYTVISTDIECNQVTVAAPDGSVITFDPSKCADKTTYAVQAIAISQGDQLRWTRNDKSQGVRNGQLVTVEAIDAKGTATLRDAKGEVSTVALSGQQYLDYALVSTTYSSQGKTADQVLVAIDSTISKEGLYVAVSRAKQKLSLYTADKQKLFKQAERSAAKENPSDYLKLFNLVKPDLVNPDAENEKAADPARALRSADQSEHLGDRTGKCVAIGHRAAVRRDSAAQSRSESATERASGLTPEYVAAVRSVVTGIEERRRAEELEGQAERIGAAAEAIDSGARQLELTAAAIAGLNEQVDRKAQRLNRRRRLSERTNVGGVAEAVLKGFDPELVARARDRIAEGKAPEPPKHRQQQREVYQQYAAKYGDRPPRECDRLVACQLMDKLLKARGAQQLTQDEQVRVGRVLIESPTSQELKQLQGREASIAYVTEVISVAQPIVERAQRTRRSQQKSRDQGMEL